MTESVLKEIRRDYQGTYKAFIDAYERKDYKRANELNEQLNEMSKRMNGRY